jgi:hypothetical protein
MIERSEAMSQEMKGAKEKIQKQNKVLKNIGTLLLLERCWTTPTQSKCATSSGKRASPVFFQSPERIHAKGSLSSSISMRLTVLARDGASRQQVVSLKSLPAHKGLRRAGTMSVRNASGIGC